MKNILVIDGQGGGLGKQLITSIKNKYPECHVMAVGTNSIATSSMIKAGCDEAATGENSIVVACRKADIIVGPIAIVIADSLLGEISAKMALAVSQANATRILIPFNHCDNIIVGVGSYSGSYLVEKAMEEIGNALA